MAQINKYIVNLFRAKVPFVFPELDEEYRVIVQAEKDRKLKDMFPKDELNRSAANYHQPHMLYANPDKGILREDVKAFESNEHGKVEIDVAEWGKDDAETIAKWIIQTFSKIENRTKLDTEYGLDFTTPLTKDTAPISRDKILALVLDKREKEKKKEKLTK